MKNKKIKYIVVLVFLVMLMTALSLLLDNNSPKKQFSNRNEACDKIKNYQDSKYNFIVYVRLTNDDNANDITNRLKKEYADLKIITISKEGITDSCFKELLDEPVLYSDLNIPTTEGALLYIEGEHKYSYLNPDNYYRLLNFLDEKGLIEKHEIIENTNLEEFKEKIKNKYVLFVIADENFRSTIESNAEKYLAESNIDYNVIDLRSTDGERINTYINKKYKTTNVYPKAIYFNNSNLVYETTVSDYDEEYQDLINKLNK